MSVVKYKTFEIYKTSRILKNVQETFTYFFNYFTFHFKGYHSSK